MIHNVGRILFRLREEMGISQAQLGRGLADVAELSRLEHGGMEPDCFLMEALFQRLGKSMDKLELVISEEEYQLIFLRSMILEGMENRNYELVEKVLKEYETYPDSIKPLHRQYGQWMRALYQYQQRKDKESCARELEEALEIMFPQWRDGIPEGWRLCMQEVRILLFLWALRLEKGEVDAARKNLTELIDYLEKWCTDTEEKAKIYPQCTWVLGKAYHSQGDWGTAYDICGRGVACLAENGILTVMDKLLEIQSACLEKMGRKEEAAVLEKIREAIGFLYQFAGVELPQGDILYLLLVREQKELLVNRELLKEMRLAKGLSQEELSEGICSWETVSRIEGGKRKPNKKKLYQMLHKMGLERERYYGYIQADDFSLYEKVRQVHAKWEQGDRMGATKLAEEIAGKLDLGIKVNRQFIETHRLMVVIADRSISGEKAVSEAERILRYTMREYQGVVYRIPSRQECILLNRIALGLKHIGRMEEALALWEQILDRFQASKVAEQYHGGSLMQVYINYTGGLELYGGLDKAEEEGMKGIRLALKCRRGDNAASMLANLSCVYEKRNTQEYARLCQECLQHSFYLLQLYMHNKNSENVHNYYRRKFGKNID
ncbi:MAG: helix-turn-helix transcriptional regulator [Lachnospiraceae bacterium]|nr:helix-turn-helix transcriptional regulator [Lachnospiraceae bacterium]